MRAIGKWLPYLTRSCPRVDPPFQLASQRHSLLLLRVFALAETNRSGMALILSCIFSEVGLHHLIASAEPSSVGFLEYIDTFDGYSLKYPQNWIQVRGTGADIFFRDPYVLDENLSVEMPSPSSSRYKTVEDLGPPEEAGKKVLEQYLTEFMSTRLGVRRESNTLSTSSRVTDDGKLYYRRLGMHV
ncbi:psbP domain-containing protein 1, chloroplastic-like isoform X1 [Hibiscus syriacus]|nr:psbP domain-containing protein 1, chloroplastic-like isoform X1 [Hibiscus syriacus]